MSIYIYILIDPFTNEVRYVGQTNNIKKRFKRHCIEASKSKYRTFSKNWINSLLKKNTKPIIQEIDCIDKSQWPFWEKHYISLYKSWGFKLTNHTDGGEGFNNCKHSEKTKELMRNIKLGNKNPFFNKTHTYETKKIMSQKSKDRQSVPQNTPNFGKKSKPETIEKLKQLALKRNLKGGNNPMAKKCYQYDINLNLIKEWDNITECGNCFFTHKSYMSSKAKTNKTIFDSIITEKQYINKELDNKKFKIYKDFIFVTCQII